jgi:hypothetical protein
MSALLLTRSRRRLKLHRSERCQRCRPRYSRVARCRARSDRRAPLPAPRDPLPQRAIDRMLAPIVGTRAIIVLSAGRPRADDRASDHRQEQRAHTNQQREHGLLRFSPTRAEPRHVATPKTKRSEALHTPRLMAIDSAGVKGGPGRDPPHYRCRQGKAPATADVLKQMLSLCPDTLAAPARCWHWASPARSVATSWWRCRWRILPRRRTACGSQSAAARRTRKGRGPRWPSCAAAACARSRPSSRGWLVSTHALSALREACQTATVT